MTFQEYLKQMRDDPIGDSYIAFTPCTCNKPDCQEICVLLGNPKVMEVGGQLVPYGAMDMEQAESVAKRLLEAVELYRAGKDWKKP
jgi:hypothetical protein